MLMACGCGALHFNHKKIDYFHFESCGPRAIQKVLANMNITMSVEDISVEIQKKGSMLRCFLGAFSNEARAITWPSEVINFFEDRGYKIKKIKNLDELGNLDNAIILIHSKGSIDKYHWLCYPNNRNIKSYYGEKTVIDDIYLVLGDQSVY